MKKSDQTPAIKKGNAFLDLLKNDSFVESTILRDVKGRMNVVGEYNEPVECDSFVSFSHDAIQAFPGSYISPSLFRDTLEGVQHPSEESLALLMGNKEGTSAQPIYSYSSPTNNFRVSIIHGGAIDHVIKLAQIAKEGFHPENRALYQQAVADMIWPALKTTHSLSGTLRIHDDCLASTVSVAGYIADLKKHNSALLNGGVDIIIDGPATAQGILFLKKCAEVYKVKISITASFLACGLTEGTLKPNGTREHANYITLPADLLTVLPKSIQKKYRSFCPDEKDIAVVGDMGNASEGIDPEVIKSMIRSDASRDTSFCSWNSLRTDPHHPSNGKNAVVKVGTWDDAKPKTNIYFPRGGYICFAYDKIANRDMFLESKSLMIGATRLWSPAHGYGVAYGVEK